MAAGAVSSASVPQHDVRWRWLLLLGCAVMLAWTVAMIVDTVGFLARPWYGWWDAQIQLGSKPWSAIALHPRPDGATAKAGIVDGDLFDLRQQSLEARERLFVQPMAAHPLTLTVGRHGRSFTTHLSGSTTWDSQTTLKVLNSIPVLISSLWFLACAALIAVRWPRSFNAPVLALIMLCLCAQPFAVTPVVVSDATLTLLFFGAVQACGLAAMLLLIRLSSRFGTHNTLRRVLEYLAYMAVVLNFGAYIATYYGIFTLNVDPSSFTWLDSNGATPSQIPAAVLIVVLAVVAVTRTPRAERTSAAWLLLPLPIAIAVAIVISFLEVVGPSWSIGQTVQDLGKIPLLLGSLAVTYAVLKRRVLDFEFVLSRALVVATVSLIVVASFVLLEWLLGSILVGFGHVTGLVANGALALALGLSLRYIHKRVDMLVDAALFRKRHDDERALLDFSKEAAYVTRPEALLDQAIAKVRLHTDARSAAILTDLSGLFAPVRSFGDVAGSVDENDGAILALKTWHKPLDPHHYATDLKAALAVPMVARGRLLAILLLGERAGGEAYAPDEVEALSQFAQGVGSALDGLSSSNGDSVAALRESMTEIAEAIASLPHAVARELRDSVTEIHKS